MTVRTFYDDLAARYHLIYENWDKSVARQGAALDSLIQEHFPGSRDILDVAVGIGTQTIGLAERGYRVTASDLSPEAVRRARAESESRGLTVPLYVGDFQQLPVASNGTPVILCCDNSLPHLASPDAIRATLREWNRCLLPGGGCLISMRDYGEPPPTGTREEHPFGERDWNGHRYALRQVWTWHGPRYDLVLEMTPLDPDAPPLPPIATSYLAIAPARVMELMREAGYDAVQRIDGRLFQPVIVGLKRNGD
jgi:SAM-dependent methyltransferase